MGKIKQNPRKYIINGSYIAALLVFAIAPGFRLGHLFLAYAALSAAYILIFRIDCLSMLANLLYATGKKERAVKIFEYVIPRNSTSPAAHLYYSVYLIRRLGGAKAALPLLERSLWLRPKPLLKKNIELTLASCQWICGEIDKAAETLEKMRETYDYVNAQVLTTLGYLYIVKGDLERAAMLTEAALADSPESYAAHDNIGQIRYAQKNLPGAREAFEKALSYKKDLPESLYYLGLISRAEGDEPKAREYLSVALECEISPLNTVTREQITEAISQGNPSQA